MEITYQNVADLLKREEISYPELSVFNNTGNTLKISYWQPMGEIVFEKENGFHCCCEKHYDEAKTFFQYVKFQKSDIVITPEYSVSWKLLEEIIKDESMWPKYGKLWCIGLEGISCDAFEDFYQHNRDGAKIIYQDLDELNQNNFLSSVAYLFQSKKQLIVIIQFKTTPAADKWAQLESSWLTTGNIIYYFADDTGRHCLFSYICADALNQGILGVKQHVKYNECLILHPQLNPKPLHDSFGYMRRGFFDYAQQNTRIISVNWAKDTLLKGNEERDDIIIEDSYSACYYNTLDDYNVGELIRRNKTKGMELSKEGHVFIWHMPSNEHSMTFTVDSFKNDNIHLVSASHKEPLGSIYLEYDDIERQWKEGTSCEICSIDWEWLKQEFQFEKCAKNACDVTKLHKFFAILLNHKQYEDVELKNGRTQVVFSKENRHEDEVVKLRERCGYVNCQLKDGNIPPKFAQLKEQNYEWVLEETGNLVSKDKDRALVNVVYVDSEQETLINKAIVKFERLMGQAAKDRMLLYYMSCKGIQYYNNLYNVEINNPNLTHAVDLIKE